MILALASATAALMMDADGAKPAQRARANLNAYFSTDDYPEAALRQHVEGTTAFRIEIDAEGAITKCSITGSSGDASLDAATCSILVSRARYQPARDARGRAVAGSDSGRVTWRLPPLPPFQPARSVSVLRTDGAGALTCFITVDGGTRAAAAPEQCGPLGHSGAASILRQARTPTEVTAIVMTGPASAGIERPNADEAGFGALQFDIVSEFTVAPNGRATGCQTIRRNIVEAAAARLAPDFCARRSTTEAPMYEATPGSAPRVARYRAALYVKGERLAYDNPAGRPRANLSSYFSTDDYPGDALRARAEGTVSFRLEINAEGRVSRCNIVESSGNASLDAKTCEVLISRARYEPARNAAGEAVPGGDAGRVTWRLPEPEPETPEPFSDLHAPVRIDLTVGADAQRRPICTVLVNGESGSAGGDALCRYVMASSEAEFMTQAPANVALTLDVAIGLENAMPPPAPLDRGTLMVDSTARLTIGANGQVTRCQVIETNLHEGIPAGAMPMNLCEFPAFGRGMFPVLPKGSPDRTGRIRIEIHFRMGAPHEA